MAWVKPTGFSDPENNFDTEENAYDDALNTACSEDGDGVIGHYVIFTRAAIDCDKIRIHNAWIIATDNVTIAVYYSSGWHNIYTGGLSSAWVEHAIGSTQSVTQIRITQNETASRIFIGELEFWEVEIVAPTVTTQAVSSIGTTTATGNGTITDDGGETPSAWGVCAAETENPDTGDTVFAGSGAGEEAAFTAAMTSLTPGTKYYVRAYATNTAGTGYGSQVEFHTNADKTANDAVQTSEAKALSALLSKLDTSDLAEVMALSTLFSKSELLALIEAKVARQGSPIVSTHPAIDLRVT